MATYCTEEKREKCDHWDDDAGECQYKRDDNTCFIGGIEDKYVKPEEE